MISWKSVLSTVVAAAILFIAADYKGLSADVLGLKLHFGYIKDSLETIKTDVDDIKRRLK